MVATVHLNAPPIAASNTNTASNTSRPSSSAPLRKGDANFTVKVATRFNLTAAATLAYSVSGNWPTATGAARTVVSRTIKLPAGVSEATDLLPASDVDLWWPAGYGSQPLYNVDVSAIVQPPAVAADGAAVAATPVNASRRVGFRSVHMDTSTAKSGIEQHVYVVNGVRIFAKGANWVSESRKSFKSSKYSLAL
jgi:hypothetical protein